MSTCSRDDSIQCMSQWSRCAALNYTQDASFDISIVTLRSSCFCACSGCLDAFMILRCTALHDQVTGNLRCPIHRKTHCKYRFDQYKAQSQAAQAQRGATGSGNEHRSVGIRL